MLVVNEAIKTRRENNWFCFLRPSLPQPSSKTVAVPLIINTDIVVPAVGNTFNDFALYP